SFLDRGKKYAFNGAALFRARKFRLSARRRRLSITFNGAALFRARKSPEVPPPRLEINSFNGAALFRARKFTVTSTSYQVPAPFNGAALFRARKSLSYYSLQCRFATVGLRLPCTLPMVRVVPDQPCAFYPFLISKLRHASAGGVSFITSPLASFKRKGS